jgi:hypothetical protein
MRSSSLRRGVISTLLAIAGLLLLLKQIEAQSIATLEGRVIDQTGSAILGAEIAARGRGIGVEA